MKTIKFHSFVDLPEGGFECVICASDRPQPDRVWFKMRPRPSTLSEDAMALTMSTLCGQDYSAIDIDLSISRTVFDAIREFTKAELSVRKVTDALPKGGRSGCALNFSGGFDSLAARAILPEGTPLVSVHFEGGFDREAEFFTKFDPCVLSTNLRALKYDRASWTFMGAGMLLFAETLGCRDIIFGTILEASDWQFLKDPPAGRRTRIPPFSGLGLECPSLIQGLSEVCTTMLIVRYCPEFMAGALKSLAAPGSEKLYRKYLLSKMALKNRGLSVMLPECRPTEPNRAATWGEHFTCDVLSLYMIKHFGLETAQKMVRGIPGEANELAKRLSLRFLERMNTNFLKAVPSGLAGYALSRLSDAGILPYDERDWEEFVEVRTFLSSYYARLRECV